VVALAARKGVAIALFGSTEPVLCAAAARLEADHPGLKVAACIAPPMGFDPESAAADALVEKGAAGISSYRNLLAQWKEAPRASKSVEDALWAQFKKAGDALYGAKAEEDKRDEETNSVNAESKKALLAEFADILSLTDRDQASQRLRTFHTRFAALGPVPKKDVRAIDDQVKKLDTHVKSLEQEFWTKNDPEKKARSESMTGQLTAAIEELESKIQSASGSEKADLESELATKKAWLAVLN
jgi:hypothetical protein